MSADRAAWAARGFEVPELPGELELRTLCDNARTVAAVCDALGIGFRGAGALVQDLEALLADDHHNASIEDGAWILPE